MAVPTAVGEYGVCKGTQLRYSPSMTSGTATPSSVRSSTKNLRLAYATVGSSGTYDTCAVAGGQYS